MAGKGGRQGAIVAGMIHVRQATPVEYGHFARFVGMTSEQRAQAALAVARQNFREQRTANERRMAALAAKGRIDDRRIARRRGADDARDGRRANERHVDRRQQEPVGVGRQRSNARLHAREHPLCVAGIVHAGDAEPHEFRRQRFRVEAGDDANAPHTCGAQAGHDMVDQRPLAERQQRLERAHARGKARRENDRDDRRGGIAIDGFGVEALAGMRRRGVVGFDGHGFASAGASPRHLSPCRSRRGLEGRSASPERHDRISVAAPFSCLALRLLAARASAIARAKSLTGISLRSICAEWIVRARQDMDKRYARD